MERSADIGERYTYKRTGCGGGSSFCLFGELGLRYLFPPGTPRMESVPLPD